MLTDDLGAGRSGLGEKMPAKLLSVSKSRICSKAGTLSHGGGVILARFWRLSKSASQSGSCAGKAGLRVSVGP